MSPTDDQEQPEHLPEDLADVASQLRQVRDEPALTPADPALLARIHATLGEELTSTPSSDSASSDSTSSGAPPAQAGAAGSHPAASVARSRRSTATLRRRSILLGGVAGVALGAVGVVAGSRVARRARVVAKATLRGLTDAAPELGAAQLVDSRQGLELEVRTHDPIDFAEGFLEVWLLNTDGQRLLSVGLFRPGDQGTYPIDRAVYNAGFVIVDISRQRYNEGLDHSGDSVMRGALTSE